MPRLFLDMDGVLADFDTGHEQTVGWRPSKVADDVDWAEVRRHEHFYRDLPPMPDFAELWSYCERLEPTILTGVPSSMREVATAHKREWADRWCGAHVPLIGCPSSEKSLHMEAGDIIVDDWAKYRHRWLARGGVWIEHTSASESIRQLREIFG